MQAIAAINTAPRTDLAIAVTAPRARLLAAFKSVAPFMCQDPTRFHMCGVALEILPPAAKSNKPQLRLVATDGHTLGRATITCDFVAAGETSAHMASAVATP